MTSLMKGSTKPLAENPAIRDQKSKCAKIWLLHIGKESRARAIWNDVHDWMPCDIEYSVVNDIPAAARESRAVLVSTGMGKTFAVKYLVSLDVPLKGAEIPLLMGMLVDGVPVVASKGAINEEVWCVKSEARRLGLAFDVAE